MAPTKRKAATMAEPAPKRVTRSRTAAKAADVEQPDDSARSTKTLASSAKKPTAPTKPKVTQITTASARAVAQRRRTPAVTEAKKDEIKVPRPRGRPAKAAPADGTTSSRGRPRRVETPVQAESQEPARVATFPARKRVQFHDETNKENEPESKAPAKSATKTTGMRAKPVRKPIGAKAKPLSPKKATQVAKGSLDQSPIEKSPPAQAPAMEIPLSPSRMCSPPRRNASSPGRLQSPAKRAVLSSSARPHFTTAQLVSPGKSTLLSDSPRKSTLSVAPVLLATTTPSLLKSPPRRLISPLRRPAFDSEPKSLNSEKSAGPGQPNAQNSNISHVRNASPETRMNDAQLDEANRSPTCSLVDESEDELVSPRPVQSEDSPRITGSGPSFTPLASQLSNWTASSPGQPRRSRRSRGMFSVGGGFTHIEQALLKIDEAPTTLFEDQFEVLEAELHSPEPTSFDVADMERYKKQSYPERVTRIAACTPAKVFQRRGPQTASRAVVPKPDLITPLRVAKKRSKSLASPRDAPSPRLVSGERLSPAQSRASPHTLQGIVAYVDVKTSDGADASGIFVDLLRQMGARCVKQWPSCPKSREGLMEHSDITHVVFKDGSKRTLDRVRANAGIKCVGVGWVLSCEQEDRWLDETLYAVDTSQIGSGRRRSMEPRRFSNPGLANAEMSPTKEFLTFNTPVSRRDTFVLDVQPVTPAEAHVLAQESAGKCSGPEDSSPETPYFLRHDAKLVQQTCPPKQRVEGLFASMEPGEDDDSNLALRQRLMAVRRKSLQWASKTKSPLGRVVINDAVN